MIKENVIYKSLKLNLFVAILFIIIGALNAFTGNYSITKNIISIGILLIIISPLLRIFLELIFFIKEKNYTYVLVCIILFVIIAISVVC
ncbi:DUF1634 domain-containing protein [Francisella tularensis]|uniref:DUF1634 domain-containing protein n=7 Tax=Francisella tularensis TaxID=263 RepID=A0AAI8FUA9_FRATH|nr:DUF1634 domain-containing protein [Francisella tularensis]ACD30908.1 conserved hypothetical protein [Francisella tularensis subsp. mediasiatica FSC147]AFX70890.1 hypothetical protein F92_06870 [Francisella tularensis subsp. holarctica F92]AHH46616.1 hypothetical protein X557_06445 [Francisella tularensis subsp. holarctica PHIT-FT049]ABI83074.1 conserved hypothetical protein [Francisella tularensis subsp. holarctica OSU18]ABO46721.1 hypothetical integral membrane protein [Francisella tularen